MVPGGRVLRNFNFGRLSVQHVLSRRHNLYRERTIPYVICIPYIHKYGMFRNHETILLTI
jgi:hypothetical protein